MQTSIINWPRGAGKSPLITEMRDYEISIWPDGGVLIYKYKQEFLEVPIQTTMIDLEKLMKEAKRYIKAHDKFFKEKA